MFSAGAAPRAAVTSSARAAASRKNGAKSCGPSTPEGKARSAQNALKHGLRAEKYVVLPDEDASEFAALEAALRDELAPEGALQNILVGRIARAAWRLERAERLEVELFEERRRLGGGPGLALIRDGNGARSFDTLLRYRGAALAELWRALRTLKALQGEFGTALGACAGAAGGRPTGFWRHAIRPSRRACNATKQTRAPRSSGIPAPRLDCPERLGPGPPAAAVSAAPDARSSATGAAERTRDPPAAGRIRAAGQVEGTPACAVSGSKGLIVPLSRR